MTVNGLVQIALFFLVVLGVVAAVAGVLLFARRDVAP